MSKKSVILLFLCGLLLAACQSTANQPTTTSAPATSTATTPPEPTAIPEPQVGTFSITNRYPFAVCDLRLLADQPDDWQDNVLVDALVPQETYTWERVPAGSVTVRAIDCDGLRVIYRTYQLGVRGHVKARLSDLYGIMTVSNRSGEEVCDLYFEPLSADVPVIYPLYTGNLDNLSNIIFSTDQPADYEIVGITCDGQEMRDVVTLTGSGELYHALEIQQLASATFTNNTDDTVCAINMNPLIERGWGINYLSVPLGAGSGITISDLPAVERRVRIVSCNNDVLWWSEAMPANPEPVSIIEPESAVVINNQTGHSICAVTFDTTTPDLSLLNPQEEILNFTSRIIFVKSGNIAVQAETCLGETIDGSVRVSSQTELIVR